MDAQEVLAYFPFANPKEAAAIMRVDVSTARRRFQKLREGGFATYHMVGRSGHMEQRWVLTREGVLHLFRAVNGGPWWVKESGLRSLYARMEQLQALYRIAPTLFDGPGRGWHELPETPRLTGCRFIRGGGVGKSRRGPGLIQAVLFYTLDIVVFFCWVGTQLGRAQMMQKWESRFEGLETSSQDDYNESLRDRDIEPPDREHDPTPYPSGYLIVGADELAFVMAFQYLPRDGDRGSRQPFLFVDAQSGLVFPDEVVVPRPHDTVADLELSEPDYIGIL